jgi:ubiquinone/menaquinone biosynthesis C-methylase UbiE
MVTGDNIMPNMNKESAVNMMRLEKTEFYAMNNPARRFIQKYWEFRIFKNFLKKHAFDLSEKVIIDAGCGSGYSSKLIMDEFKPSELIAFDIMPEQIAIAKRRYKNIDFRTGDLMQIKIPDNTADAVSVFGIIHHIPEWRKALKNISGFLKKSGVFLIEEPRERYTSNWNIFEKGIFDSGLIIQERKNIFGLYFRSYMCVKNKQ